MTHLKTLLSSFAFSTILVACGEVPSSSMEPGPDASIEEPGRARIELSADAAKVPILQGAAVELTVSVTRLDGATGPVEVFIDALPSGVTASPLTIGARETSGTLTLTAAASAPHSLPTHVAVRGVLDATTASTSLTVTIYGSPGSLDTSFGGGRIMLPAGDGDDYANAVVVQPDGKLILAGSGAEHLGDFALIRLDRDGSLDTSFGSGGRVLTDFAGASEGIYALALQPDGKIVAAGYTTVSGSSLDFAVARYNTDGSLDSSFGSGGKVTTAVGPDIDLAYALLIGSDGTIVVGGNSNRGWVQSTGLDFALVRYTSSGQLDTGFGNNGITITQVRPSGATDSIYALTFQTVDGEQRIVAAGGEGDFSVARYRANGSLDLSFGSNGTVVDKMGSTMGAARAVAITPSGAIVLAGHAQEDFALLQLDDTGAVDLLFGSQGKVITPVSATNSDEARALAFDTGGKLVVAGWVWEGNSSAGNFAVARYLTDGHLDPAFGTAGIVVAPVAPGTKPDEGRTVAIQQDDRVPTHRIILAGSASNSNSDFAVTRFWR